MSAPPVARPEDRARTNIDRLLIAAGWLIQNRDSINIEAGRGVAIREFVLTRDHGFADYLLYIDGYAAGVVEAKKAGLPLTGVEIQTAKYSEGLPANLPAPRRPLPFCYQSTGIETASPISSIPTPAVAVPIETFDFLITDECHRSIYNLWRQVLEYFRFLPHRCGVLEQRTSSRRCGSLVRPCLFPQVRHGD